MCVLPEEIIIEILLQLPVKDLIRFKSVSKFFFSIINGHDFINHHLRRSIQSNNTRLLNLILCAPQWAWNYQNTTRFCAANIGNGLNKQSVELSSPLKSSAWICGSRHGLLLLCTSPYRLTKYRPYTLCLWNPSTRRYKILPYCPSRGRGGGLADWDSFGLGYDSACDDYKVVYIKKPDLEVWVFGLRCNCWKRIQDFPFNGYEFCGEWSGRFVDGVLYWLCRRNNYEEYGIVSFDTATELFSEIPTYAFSPEGEDDILFASLDVLGGLLCLNLFNLFDRMDCYIREKDDAGVFSWKLLCKVELADLGDFSVGSNNSGLDYVRLLVREGHRVMVAVNGTRIIWYDLEQKRGEMVRIDNRIDRWFHTVVCWESLVSVGDGSEFDGNTSGISVNRTC